MTGERDTMDADNRRTLERINAAMKAEGFGQGELDDDLAGCVEHRLQELNDLVRKLAAAAAAATAAADCL